MVISLLVPQNEDRIFPLRRSFLLKVLAFSFAILFFLIWYNYVSLPPAEVFSPILSPVMDYIYRHYTLPLADFYTTDEGSNPLFWPTVGVITLIVLFVSWRAWFYIRRWKRRQTTVMIFGLAIILPTTLGADDPVPTPPQKVETSVGIYDVQSKDDLLNFTAEEIRELVRIEDDRIRGAGKPPHPVLVYCFEERSFQYTGGKYDNAEIKYRLHVPQKIVPGKKYPLVVHLHGSGEAGNDNTLSLAHLHSILPIIAGPEQLDFFLLVTQSSVEDSANWSFSKKQDGNLDIAFAAMEDVIRKCPIDEKRLSVFGLSSGGYGVWQILEKRPEVFAAAVPVSIAPASYYYDALPQLKNVAIWTFKNSGDAGVSVSEIRKAMEYINGSGGYMKLTQFDQGGHAAWRPAMDEYNCFAWMIAQKRGGWFNPPPERKVYQGRSLFESFYAFFLPLMLAGGLFMFQRTALCERLHEQIADRLYRRWDDEDEDEEYEDDDEEEESDDETTDDGFRVLTDITGTKKIKAKILGFQGDAVRIESPDGKIATVAIKHFSETDREWLRKMQAEQPLPEGFRIWTDTTGTKKITAKLVELLPDGKIRLESEAGKIMTVDPKFFCEADRQWIREQQPSN